MVQVCKSLKASIRVILDVTDTGVSNILLILKFTSHLMETKLDILFGNITLLICGLLFVSGQRLSTQLLTGMNVNSASLNHIASSAEFSDSHFLLRCSSHDNLMIARPS